MSEKNILIQKFLTGKDERLSFHMFILDHSYFFGKLPFPSAGFFIE